MVETRDSEKWQRNVHISCIIHSPFIIPPSEYEHSQQHKLPVVMLVLTSRTTVPSPVRRRERWRERRTICLSVYPEEYYHHVDKMRERTYWFFALRNHNYRGNLSLPLTFLSRPGGDVASVMAARGRLKRKTVEMRKSFIHSFIQEAKWFSRSGNHPWSVDVLTISRSVDEPGIDKPTRKNQNGWKAKKRWEMLRVINRIWSQKYSKSIVSCVICKLEQIHSQS